MIAKCFSTLHRFRKVWREFEQLLPIHHLKSIRNPNSKSKCSSLRHSYLLCLQEKVGKKFLFKI